jgi:ComF family protein
MNGAAAWLGRGSALLERFLSLFYPEICQLCHSHHAAARQSYLCDRCRGRIEYINEPFCNCCGLPFEGDITVKFECANCRDQQLHFRSARSAAAFTGVMQEVIHQYKYNHASWFEPFLFELLVQRAAPALSANDWDWIVPIPLHWLRLRERTFNQSLRLANHLSKATGIPINRSLLRRVRQTPSQTHLTRGDRIENVKRAFAWRSKQTLDGARVILVDDVLTTGATASACAKILMRNGASIVDVWTVARGLTK